MTRAEFEEIMACSDPEPIATRKIAETGTPKLGDPCRALTQADIDAYPDASRPRAPAQLPVNLLALDLGTNCGWAVAKRDGRVDYGTEKFPIRVSGAGERWARYRAWLSNLINRCQIEVVYFEDVKAHGPGQVLAAHAYGAFLAMTEMVCHQHRVRMVGVGVGQVKKAFTGRGNAKKEDMVTRAGALGYRLGANEHDTADAIAILSYGVSKEKA